MRLFDFNRAPNPRRVRIFLAEKGLQIQRIPVDLYRGEQLSPEFLAINPGGTVPVLETDDGTYLSECVAICSYLEDLHPEPCLFGTGPLERARVLMWNSIVEHEGLRAIAEVLRNLSPGFRGHALPGRVAIQQIPALVERGRRRSEQFLDRMEHRLAESPYLAGEEFSLADISLLATVDFSDWVDLRALDARPALARWHRRVASRPSAGA
jgi:glutathione S-transferase